MYVHALMGAELTPGPPVIRTIGVMDLKDVLARGMSDFSAMPTHVVFLCLIYPIVGLILARVSFGYDFLSLLFPLAAGFALIGPFAAIGLYELSRQREQGLDISWEDAFDVLHSPSRDAIAALGFLLLAIFMFWLAVAEAIYIETIGYEPAASISEFRSPSLHYTRRLDAHRRRQRHRLPVRARGLDLERGFISAAARPRCRRR